MKPSTITGFLIRYHRLKQNISQEGLCKGICVVSYLSKIEQGIVCASDDELAPFLTMKKYIVK